MSSSAAAPAGLEAARVSAERGHEVSLFEAASELGGEIRIGAGSWRHDLMGIVEWREAELKRLGVSVHTSSYMESADVTALEPDVVILATGGLPQIDLREGADLCHSTWDVLSGQVPLSGEVLIYDGTGRHPGPLVAEQAKEAGADVIYLSVDAQLAEELTFNERLRWKKRFFQLRPQMIFENRLVAVRRGQSANDVVTDLRALVNITPQPRLREAGFELHRIGDAVSSRNIYAAVLDAMRICSAI